MKNPNFKYGIYFWSGAGVYSFINFLLNSRNISSKEMSSYNLIIIGAAVFGIALNSFLLMKQKKLKK